MSPTSASADPGSDEAFTTLTIVAGTAPGSTESPTGVRRPVKPVGAVPAPDLGAPGAQSL